MTPAERHDAALILRRLSQPCPHGAEHDWMKCPRCLTIEELGHHKGRIFDLMAKAAAALTAPPAAPRNCACGPSDVCRDDGCQCACHVATPTADLVALLREVLDSARPSPRDHPTMSAAWAKAAIALGDAALMRQYPLPTPDRSDR